MRARAIAASILGTMAIVALSGATVPARASEPTLDIAGAGFVIDGHGDLGHRMIRREVADGMMLMTILNPDANVQCKLYFERMETD